MAIRPSVVAFDVIETTFSLEALRPRLRACGLPGQALETWFARILRDAFALAATDRYAPFREVATATLDALARENGRILDPAETDAVLAAFGELDAHPDAAEAFRVLRNAGIRVAALSNGAAETTQKLLERAALAPSVERVISIAEIRQWKPRAEIYHHAAQVLGVAPSQLALVATHAWDVHGAKQAGLTTGFVARGQPFPPVMAAPDVTAETLADVARAIVALPAA